MAPTRARATWSRTTASSAWASTAILGNAIFGNAKAGLELTPVLGPIANDPLDPDFGPNEQQNFPVLVEALAIGGATEVSGFLKSEPNAGYRIEVFASGACDPSGMGEGASFLGALEVATDAGGHAAIMGSLPATNLGFLSATATSPEGSTSEFSSCIVIGGANPGAFQLAADPFLAYEQLGSVTITVTRSIGVTGEASVAYETVAGSATSPQDYGDTSGVLTFADGEVLKTFSIPLVLDASGEATQKFKVELSSPTGGAGLGDRDEAEVLLFDYEKSFPGTSIAGGAVVEGDAGTSEVAFTVAVTPADVPLQVKVKTVDGTAVAGQDYVASSFSLTFQPGEGPKVVKVPVVGDLDSEGNEAFFLTYDSVSQGYVSDDGIATIVDDDAGPEPLCLGGAVMGGTRLVISGLDKPPGMQKLELRGRLPFAAGTPTGTTPLDLVTKGAQIRVRDLGSDGYLDLTSATGGIPAGAEAASCVPGKLDGWTSNVPQTTWVFRNRSGAFAPDCVPGSAQGIVRLQIADRRATIERVRVRLLSRGVYAAPNGEVRVTVVLAGDPSAGLAGACGGKTFAKGSCKLNAAGSKVICD